MATLTKLTNGDGTELFLDGSTGVKVMRGAAGLDGLPRFNTIDQKVGADGAIRPNTRLTERALSIPVMIDESMTTAAEVARIVQGPCLLTAGSNRTLRDVVYESGLEAPRDGEMGGIDGLGWRKFNLHLLALDPWWYGPIETFDGEFGSGVTWDSSNAWNSNMPWNGGASETLTITGDVAALPTVVVTGAADRVGFSVGGRGGWEINATIPSGTYVSVASDPARRGPHRGPHGFYPAADGPIDWSLLREGSQLFELPPGLQDVVFSASGTDSNTAWSIWWHPRFLTP